MFEHASLQEAYTGALMAGKGKGLNNISLIMERSKFKYEDWVRVRFGAGTPWQRCWCVVSPPDEKEYQKILKEMNKKKSAYDRSRPLILRGDIKFYENNKKTKKAKPLAQVTDVYSAFSIYPQSKPLIDASTLVKVEGAITIFSNPPTVSEGFVFVMPEVHPAVSGFEMMLRWLFPVWDAFALYGRPGRLIADTHNPNSLMFAMPKERRYGYLEILDISGLILTEGSQNWSEGEWRRNMKDLTAKRMATVGTGSGAASRYSSRRSTRNSFGPSRSQVNFNDAASANSTQSTSGAQRLQEADQPRTELAPPANILQPQPNSVTSQHHRSISESQGLDRYADQTPSGYDGINESPPAPPPHTSGHSPLPEGSNFGHQSEVVDTLERFNSEDERSSTPTLKIRNLRDTPNLEPVAKPPAFSHAPGSLPAAKPYHPPELRKAKSRISDTTLAQMAGAGGMTVGGATSAAYGSRTGSPMTDGQKRDNRAEQSLAELPSQYQLSSAAQSSSAEEQPYIQTNSSSQKYQTPTLPLHGVAPTAFSRPEHSNFQNSIPISLSDETRTLETQKFSASVTQIATPTLEHSPQSHARTPVSDSSGSRRPSHSEKSPIFRKPLPVRNSLQLSESPVDTPSSLVSLGDIIDQAGFDRVVPRGHANPTASVDLQVQLQSSAGSLHEDTISNSSPDYASTHESVEARMSVERPRAGVMRTVGGAEPSDPKNSEESSFATQIDFGPTLNYAAIRAPRRPSPDKKADVHAQEYGRSPRSSSRNAMNTDVGQNRNDPNASAAGRTVPWQPGMAAAGTIATGGQPMSPEQFIQQRAAATTTPPLYVHQRQSSANTVRSGTPTPPARNQSSEFFSHSRNSSGDPFQRPNSRGASVALGVSGSGDYSTQFQRPNSRGASVSLGVSGSGDYSTHLSAREQEHVARVTGSPLINIPEGTNRVSTTNNGLVGAISAREKEKRDLKQGMHSQAVQQAIMQRQQQNQTQLPTQQGQAPFYPQARPSLVPVQTQYQGQRQHPEQYAAQPVRQSWVQSTVPQASYGPGGQYQAYTATSPQPQLQPQLQFQPQSQPQATSHRPQQQQQFAPVPSYPPQLGVQQQPQLQAQPQPQPPLRQQQPQQQGQWVTPAASVFAQGGGWSAPQPRITTPEQQQRQQYFQQQQQSQGQMHGMQMQGMARGNGQQAPRGQGQWRG
jgi:CCR4-NOT transcriptional complex subunit CAF120